MSLRPRKLARPRAVPDGTTPPPAAVVPPVALPPADENTWEIRDDREGGRVVAAGSGKFRGPGTLSWPGDGPVGTLRLYTRMYGEMRAGPWVKGDGDRITVLVCGRRLANNRPCQLYSGHNGACM